MDGETPEPTCKACPLDKWINVNVYFHATMHAYSLAWFNCIIAFQIEDPFERPDNAARAVRLRELSMISEAFMTTSQKLSSYSVLSDRNALLDCLVRPNIKAHTHCSTRENPEEPQLAYSGHATVHEHSKDSSQRKVGTQSCSTAKQNWKRPQVAFSGYAVSPPDQGKIREALDKHNSLSLPSVLNRWELDKPQVASSGYAVCAPDHERIQEAANKHSSRSSPLVATRQRQGYANGQAQQIWRPKNSSRWCSCSAL